MSNLLHGDKLRGIILDDDTIWLRDSIPSGESNLMEQKRILTRTQEYEHLWQTLHVLNGVNQILVAFAVFDQMDNLQKWKQIKDIKWKNKKTHDSNVLDLWLTISINNFASGCAKIMIFDCSLFFETQKMVIR